MTITVLTIIDRMPYSALTGEVGSQWMLVRNSLILTSRKAGTAEYRSRAKIPTRMMIVRTPFIKKNVRTADSFRLRSPCLVMVIFCSLVIALFVPQLPFDERDRGEAVAPPRPKLQNYLRFLAFSSAYFPPMV